MTASDRTGGPATGRGPDMGGAPRVRIEIAFRQRVPGGEEIDFDAKILAISAAAEMAGMHPQTLRQYDRLGLVEPARTPGGGRRYSAREALEKLAAETPPAPREHLHIPGRPL